MMKRLGIDIGSLSLSVVLLEDEQIVARHSCAHEGRINERVTSLLARPPFSRWDSVGLTGSLAGTGARIIDTTLATIDGARRLLPSCRNLIAMGGQSFSLILVDRDGRYVEHVSNPPCASGTGSFLEQQAERLGLSIQDLVSRAVNFTGEVPRIATRCAVFAKTDIVHAMQEGHSLDAVCAGLCEGIARSMVEMLRKGRKLEPPVGLVGGVALNGKIVESIARILGIGVVVPENCQYAAALGAAVLGTDATLEAWTGLHRSVERRPTREPLPAVLADYPSLKGFEINTRDDVEIFGPTVGPEEENASCPGFFLGIDIGSTSTKAALVNAEGTIAQGFYTRTGGNPVAAVQRLLRVIEGVRGQPTLRGAATTGSGRFIIRQVFQADKEVNEITAHARAAVHLRPDVDTIIEIGGQDSKFTLVRDGDVYFSVMNYVCAAGTGSFIEEQAKRLGASLSDFSDMALAEGAPFTSDRCTVYMERDLAALVGEGWPRETLAAAVLHSVRDNYLSKVVGKSPVGDSIVFQGATGRNRALVAAFEQHLGKTVHVSAWCHLTGAVGAALLCRDEGLAVSGFAWKTGEVLLGTEECRLCANHCRLTVMDRGSIRTGWGMKCGREYADRKPKSRRSAAEETSSIALRFTEAMRPLYEPPAGLGSAALQRKAVTIGIPRSLYNISYAPLWRSFLSRLGFSVITSDQDREAMDAGAECVNSDFCAPMVLSHGYVKQLVDKGADFVFLPAIENSAETSGLVHSTFRRRDSDSAYCYYSQYLPSVVGKLTAFNVSDRLISPLLPLREKSAEETAGLLHEALAARFPDLTREETFRAFTEANVSFASARAQLALTFQRAAAAGPSAADDPLRVLILGRPYVAFDESLSLSLPRTFERLGAAVFWQEELELEDFPLTYGNQYLERMHWHYGKLIVRAAEYAARTENLFPVFLTCFRCSPDSFLMSYVKDILTHFGKPFLFLQLDAHASDVGYLTRIEAALHSFRNHRRRESTAKKPVSRPAVTHARNDQLSEGDTVLIPAVDTLISSFWADVFARMGHPAILLEAGATAVNTGYRFSSGGECMPLVSIIGAAIEKVRGDSLDPSKTFFFMPTSPFSCNMPQFPVLSDMAFRAAGIEGLKIGKLNFMALGDTLPQTLSVKILETYIVACILYKLASRVRPYELKRGQTDRALQEAQQHIRYAIRSSADLRACLAGVVGLFRAVERNETHGRKPRVALLGDLYVKYNAVMNEGIQSLIEKLGGELVISSMTEYPAHLLDIGSRRYGEDPRSGRILRSMEQRYERLAEDLIGDQAEPDFAECVKLMEEHGYRHYIAGETSINVGKALWYCTKRSVEAIVHINPMFCCPGVVTASLYRKIQADFGVPIIDIFFDGTGSPNRVLIPHLHYKGPGAPLSDVCYNSG
jgi:predicted CoA-substrate-specific enzyme activase